MQWFVVKYRKPDGAMAEAEFEASDKSALFKLLAEKKISAINIQPGRIGKKSGSKSAAKGASSRYFLRMAIGVGVGVAMVACMFVAFYLFKPSDVKVPANERNAKSKTLPAAAKKIRQDAVVSNVVDVTVLEEDGPAKSHPDIGRQVTNLNGKVYTVKYVSKPGVRIENGVVIEDRPLFKHDSLNELDALYRTTPGFRIYSGFDAEKFDKDIIDALVNEKIDITDEDTAFEVERKKLIARGLEEIKGAIASGESPAELVKAARKELSEMADLRDDCIAVLLEMKNDGASAEEIEEYYKIVNKKLEERSIPALLSPATAAERLQAAEFLKQSKEGR